MTHYRFQLSTPYETFSIDVEQTSIAAAFNKVYSLYGDHYSVSAVECPLYNPPANTRRYMNRHR